MARASMWALVALVTILDCTGCGAMNGSSLTAPTAPTAAIAPIPSPAPPAPATTVMTFVPDASNSGGKAIVIVAASHDPQAGKITLSIAARDLIGIYGTVGRIQWDDALFEPVGYDPGNFIKPSDMPGDWAFLTLSAPPGSADFDLTRPSSLPAANGSGEIFSICLRLRSGVRPTPGTSLVRFISTTPGMPGVYFYGENGERLPVDYTAYGGAIVIQ